MCALGGVPIDKGIYKHKTHMGKWYGMAVVAPSTRAKSQEPRDRGDEDVEVHVCAEVVDWRYVYVKYEATYTGNYCYGNTTTIRAGKVRGLV